MGAPREIPKSHETLISGTKLISVSSLAPTQYQNINQRILDIRTSMAEDELRYTNYTSDSQVEGVWAEQSTATVIWTEKGVQLQKVIYGNTAKLY